VGKVGAGIDGEVAVRAADRTEREVDIDAERLAGA
jgi:hypothetical protein